MNQHELNVEAEAIRELACEVFNWPRCEVDKFSLATLKDLARTPVAGAAYTLPPRNAKAKRLHDAIDNWQREWRGR